jgi:hypothetical protein
MEEAADGDRATSGFGSQASRRGHVLHRRHAGRERRYQCTDRPAAPAGRGRIDNQNSVSPTLNTVRVIDDSLARYKNKRYDVKSVLDVERTNVTRSEAGFSRISLELRNKTDGDIPLEVRTSWYDASRRPVDTAASWTRVFARPMSVVLYEHVAASPSANQYCVEVRGAQ